MWYEVCDTDSYITWPYEIADHTCRITWVYNIFNIYKIYECISKEFIPTYTTGKGLNIYKKVKFEGC